jgi:hypothetical protein
MHWYDPMTRTVEDVPAPSTDEETVEMLSGIPDSGHLRRSTSGCAGRVWAVSKRWSSSGTTGGCGLSTRPRTRSNVSEHFLPSQ